MLELVGINNPERRFNQYPQTSGGCDKGHIVMYLYNLQLLIADEPTTALDVTIKLKY